MSLISAQEQRGSSSGIEVLNDNEERIVGDLLQYLRSKFPHKLTAVESHLDGLDALGKALSRFPPVDRTELLHEKFWERRTDIHSLCSVSPASRLLRTPTRIAAARIFWVAKLHTFALLSSLAEDEETYIIPLRKIIFLIVSVLMADDIYLACLYDPLFPSRYKMALADDLADLWDGPKSTDLDRHFTALQALWAARDGAPPCFGTMDGSSELVRLTLDLNEDWQGFIISLLSDDEARWALEEFLFGLSYEEIVEVRFRLKRFGVTAVDGDEVRSFLGNRPAYSVVNGANPQGIYDFYIERRDTACFRDRSSFPGPKKTLEELYLKYRLLRNS